MSTGTPLNNPELAAGQYEFGTIVEDTYVDPVTAEETDYRVVIKEIEGREGDNSPNTDSAEVMWLIEGSYDPKVCRHALLNGALDISTYDQMGLVNLRRKRFGLGWKFIGEYDSRIPEVGGYTLSVDTTGATINQTYAYNTRRYAATDKTATNFGNAIDVQDGKIQGVQVVVPSLKLTVRARIATEYLTAVGGALSYAILASQLTGSTNSTPMFDNKFAVGELLFLGMIGELVGENPIGTFKFDASKNLSSFDVGDVSGIRKDGHEYIWWEHEPSKDDTTGRQSTEIVAAHVNQPCPSADLTQLKIGVAPT